MTQTDLYAFMARHRLGVLGTISQSATPQSALMGIAITPKLEIIFDTVKSSRKYPNLISLPVCSFVVGGWGASEQTVQYEGLAEELNPPELEQCLVALVGAVCTRRFISRLGLMALRE